MTFFNTYIFPHLNSLPYYVIWLGGIVYAVVYRKKHPRTSLFAGSALAIMLLNSVISMVISSYFLSLSITGLASPGEHARRMSTLSCLSTPFSMLAWFLLLIAVFGWKRLTETESVESSQPKDILL